MKTRRTISVVACLLTGLAIPVPFLGQGGQVSIASVTFNPPSVTGGKSATATVTLSGAAGNNGFDVALSINSNVAQLPSSAIKVAAGQTSASVQVATIPTVANQLATLTASARGDTRTANLTVTPPAIAGLSVSPSPVDGGQQVSVTATLSGTAPPGGSVVNLTATGGGLTLPSSITVPAGQVSATQSAPAAAVPAETQVTVTATAGGASRTASVRVRPAPLTLSTFFFSSSLESEERSNGTVRLSGPAPTGGATIQFSNTGKYVLGSCPLVDTIPAGETTLYINCFGARTSRDTAYTITATFNGQSMTRTGILRAPTIRTVSIPDTIASGYTRTLTVTLLRSGSGPYPVTITSDNPAIQSPGAVNIVGPNAQTLYYSLKTNTVAEPTSGTVTVTGKGRTFSEPVIVVPAKLSQLEISPASVRGGQTVTLKATLVGMAPPSGARVMLQRSFAAWNLPTFIPIAAGSNTGSITLPTPSFVPATFDVTISGTYNGITKTATARISPGL